jgi:glutaminyl-peptide cyclotransferase
VENILLMRFFLNHFIAAFLLLFMISACKPEKKNTDQNTNNTVAPSYPEVKMINYNLLGQSPHDLLAFTEGLLFNNGKLYESTGSPEEYPMTKSIIGEVDMATGRIILWRGYSFP